MQLLLGQAVLAESTIQRAPEMVQTVMILCLVLLLPLVVVAVVVITP
jgi:hypothetical protein